MDRWKKKAYHHIINVFKVLRHDGNAEMGFVTVVRGVMMTLIKDI